MPWYKTGTVSVVQNSNAVIGTNTAFIANARVGDAFRGPDGGWYEVINVASDTALSISPLYQGPTNAVGTYALAPMQGYVKDSADALRALVNQFGGVMAVLGTTATTDGVRAALNLSTADGLPEGGTNKYMTGNGVRATALTGLVTTDPSAVVATDALLIALGKLQAQASAKAGKGANTDITSITGLTTALAVSQGGTGGKTPTDARVGLGLKSAAVADVVGTMANGAIIENISNANGSCVRFSDGTQICTIRRFVTVNFTDALAAMYSHAGELFLSTAYPAAFVGVPAIGWDYSQAGWYGFLTESTLPTASAWPGLKALSLAAVNGVGVNFSLTATGRWKA